MYGISRFCRWLLGCALGLSLAVSVASAANTGTLSFSGPSGASATVTITYNSDASVTINWSRSHAQNANGNWVFFPDLSISGANTGISKTSHNGWTWTTNTQTAKAGTWTSPAGVPGAEWTVTFTDINVQTSASNGSQTKKITLGPCTPQDIAVSPSGPLTIELGGDVIVAAAGADTSYAYSAPGGISVSQAGDVFTITGVTPGTYTLEIWAVEAGLYCQSEKVPVEITVGEPKYCVSWKIHNGLSGVASVRNPEKTDHYRMEQNGEIIAEMDVVWGDTVTFKKEGLETNDPVTLSVIMPSAKYSWDEKNQVWVPNALQIDSVVVAGTKTPTTSCAEGGSGGAGGSGEGDGGGGEDDEGKDYGVITPPVTNPTSGGSGTAPTTDPQQLVKDSGGNTVTGTLWSSGGTDEGLTDERFMEGIGKLEKQLIALNSLLADGLGGTDPNAEAVEAAAAAGAAATDGHGNGDGAGAAADDTGDAFDAGSVPSSLSMPSGSGSVLRVTVAGFTLSADPADDPQISALADFIKQACVWIFSLVFAWWCWGEFARICQQVMSAQQAKGNAVIGGTGGQATALVAAGAITAILVAVPAAYWAFATYDIQPIGNVSGPGSTALYFLFFFVPVSALLGFVVAAFAVRKAGVVLVAATSTLIRFVVP